ncbi:major facilitator superfamily domain-containing protein [Bombardia bombarda]|uniref:Major facilitator superfamily domain-containing protein n=1 Tax=Bombardia bombarda TaxID=252184 RepID=A0AA40C8M0_9PEZI|nr:major facilitator superfamily domain-containing protein [Bombardia bombarda]
MTARRVNRKLDFALLPLLSLLYLFNGLDRSNVGNAQTQGFTDDIGAQPDDLNFALSLFFLTFVLLQPLSAAVGLWIGPKHWIPIMMVPGSLIATRLLIGAFESGFYPTVVSYLTTFYSPSNLAVRLGWFYGQYAIAGAFSGAIAYGIFHIQHPSLKTWQLLFIIEGSLTCVVALVAWVWLPSRPETAWFLNEEERRFAAEQARDEQGGSDRQLKGETSKGADFPRDVMETIKDWKLWFALVCNICASVPSTALSVFLPLVVEGMGYSSLQANVMTVPPYICGAVGLYLFALSSDRHNERGYHIYGGLCVFLFGSYVSPLLTVAWLSKNTPAPGKRALILGVNGWGNVAGVIGSQLYKQEYGPEYRLPFFVTLGFVAAALVGYLAYRFALQAVNNRRAAIKQGKSAEEIQCELNDDVRYADRKWTFQYWL